MKIFKKIEYVDGGIDDRGKLIGFIRTNKEKEELYKEQGHRFIEYIEVSHKEYLVELREKRSELEVYKINTV